MTATGRSTSSWGCLARGSWRSRSRAGRCGARTQASRVEHYGRDGYWDTFWEEDDLFYSTVAGFKGLERPAVVLAVDGFRDEATAREILYVGLSRVRDLLVVVADPATLRRVGGETVAARVMGEG